ncbi:type VI secretion system tip protein VgrG, partial [Vibrio anguillarum]|nr:type VI secretion system tip protein VgrG [Vibrio anguillarum]
SGGSAGSGSGYGGVVAALPMGLAAPSAPDELVLSLPTASLIQQVIADIKTEMPITQVCQKRSDGSCPLSDCPCGNNK